VLLPVPVFNLAASSPTLVDTHIYSQKVRIGHLLSRLLAKALSVYVLAEEKVGDGIRAEVTSFLF
jgi:hypothetical protein